MTKTEAPRTARRKKPVADEDLAAHAPIELRYRLVDLPSSLHRAGLAGLVLLIRWLERNAERKKGILEVVRIDAGGATIRVDLEGMKSLFDEAYAATWQLVPESKIRKDKAKAEIAPHSTVEVDDVDPKTGEPKLDKKTGQPRKKTLYLYPKPVPRGAFLVDFDPSVSGDDGVWVGQWRQMIWEIVRGNNKTRVPYVARAEGAVALGIELPKKPNDATDAFQAITSKKAKPIGLKMPHIPGMVGETAERVLLSDLPQNELLLQLWPLSTSVYRPRTQTVKKGKPHTSYPGFVLCVPDVRDLAAYCAEIRDIERRRLPEARYGRPRGGIIDVPAEGALSLFARTRHSMAEKARQISDDVLVTGVDVVHVEKVGNNLRVHDRARIEPDPIMIGTYADRERAYWSPLFRQRRMASIVSMSPWWTSFATICSTSSRALTIGNDYFRHDARLAFEDKERPRDMETGNDATLAIENLVYDVVTAYVFGRLERKYQLRWDHEKQAAVTTHGVPASGKEYQEKREKIATDLFLATRSRTGADFVALFTSTICSIPQRSLGNQEKYLALTQALLEDTEKVRTLTLLALSARA